MWYQPYTPTHTHSYPKQKGHNPILFSQIIWVKMVNYCTVYNDKSYQCTVVKNNVATNFILFFSIISKTTILWQLIMYS